MAARERKPLGNGNLESSEDLPDEAVQGLQRDPCGAVRRVVMASVLNGVSSGLSRRQIFDGSPEEGSWFETSREQRARCARPRGSAAARPCSAAALLVRVCRCARNHVRMLLRGKLWYEAQLVTSKESKAAK